MGGLEPDATLVMVDVRVGAALPVAVGVAADEGVLGEDAEALGVPEALLVESAVGCEVSGAFCVNILDDRVEPSLEAERGGSDRRDGFFRKISQSSSRKSL